MTDEPDASAETERQRKRLLEQQLAAAPLLEVLGVVAPNGVGGVQYRDEELWTLRFTLESWRIVAADLQTGNLQVSRKVTHEELREFIKLIAPYTVIRVRVRVVVDSLLTNSQALLEEYIGVETLDAELNAIADQLQLPVTFEDSLFGTFTLDRKINWFAGNSVWSNRPVRLDLSLTENENAEDTLETAHLLWQSQELWSRRIEDYAVQKLLLSVNEDLEDGEEVTAEQFKERMKLESITVNRDGSFEFWHDDGDLFGGHSICISGDLKNGLTDIDTPG